MILPDVLVSGLKVVFCGTAPGDASAQAGAYYAGPGNRFWQTLHQVSLTPYQLHPCEFPTVIRYGIGLTDLAKQTSGSDSRLRKADFDPVSLRTKILTFKPRMLAFTSKRAAQEYLGIRCADYGPQRTRIGETTIFVLPSPSGAARGYWDVAWWWELAETLS